MNASTNELPFELVLHGNGSWRGRWAAKKVGAEVSVTDEAPDAALLQTLIDVIGRWTEIEQAIAAFVRALAPDHHVPLDPATVGGFAARRCGFDGDLVFESISVTTREAPRRAEVTFYTGYPDGYATYEVVLDGGTPTAISAFAS
jgi:hypothetical protein